MAFDRLPAYVYGARVGPLLLNCDHWPLRLVADELALDIEDFMPCRAIGIVRRNSLVAGVVYHQYRPEQGDCELSVASRSKRWASREVLGALLAYPFRQLECRRISARVRADNRAALRFNLGLGWQVEGVIREWYAPGVDAVMLGMTREEWERGRYYVER